jgi:hypothetical protein
MTAQQASATSTWKTMPAPFRPVNITAIGGVLFACGADEMILSSKDNGVTCETTHQNSDGEVLLGISFVDEKVGYATGTGGLLLSTVDGGVPLTMHSKDGETWIHGNRGLQIFLDFARDNDILTATSLAFVGTRNPSSPPFPSSFSRFSAIRNSLRPPADTAGPPAHGGTVQASS